MNKGDPRKALRTRPQPTTSVPVIGKSPGNEAWGITYVKMPTSVLCTCISFSLVLCFFKTLNSNFTFECPTNAILQRVSKKLADQRGGSVPPLFFDQQYKLVYRCAYASTQNENMQIKWRAAWLSLGLFVRSKISVLGFPTRNRPSVKTNLGTGWFVNLKNGIIKSLRQGAPAIFYGIKPGLTVA